MTIIRPSVANLDRERLRTTVLDNFEHGFNCAEAIFVAFAEHLNEDLSLMRIATPFGAGIGGRRDLCGILIGGAMVVGLLYGRTDPDDLGSKRVAYGMAAQYYRWFKVEKKQLHCSEIVPGKFTGHTANCVCLMDEAQAVLVDIVAHPSGSS